MWFLKRIFKLISARKWHKWNVNKNKKSRFWIKEIGISV
jgi:hypothetical protein